MKNEPQGEFEQIFHLHVKHFTCDALHNLVPFVQLKKTRKHAWRSVTFSTVAG